MAKETTKAVITEKDLFKDEKAASAAEEKAVTAGQSLQKTYQRIVCTYLVHLAKHKDIRVIRRMLDNMPQSLRKDSMQKFILQYGTVKAVEDENGKATYHYDGTKKLQLGLALEKAWWLAKAPTE